MPPTAEGSSACQKQNIVLALGIKAVFLVLTFNRPSAASNCPGLQLLRGSDWRREGGGSAELIALRLGMRSCRHSSGKEDCMQRKALLMVGAAAIAAAPSLVSAQHQHDPASHGMAAAPGRNAPTEDRRVQVEFPAELRDHTLANMRDHLLTLQEIQAALAKGRFDQAAEAAERRLGMSSLAAHGAHEVAKYMPQGMQDMGSAMHRSASRFAIAAQDSAAANDVKPALGALAEVTANCVACHAAYRLK
jgi:hypothetical protein